MYTSNSAYEFVPNAARQWRYGQELSGIDDAAARNKVWNCAWSSNSPSSAAKIETSLNKKISDSTEVLEDYLSNQSFPRFKYPSLMGQRSYFCPQDFAAFDNARGIKWEKAHLCASIISLSEDFRTTAANMAALVFGLPFQRQLCSFAFRMITRSDRLTQLRNMCNVLLCFLYLFIF